MTALAAVRPEGRGPAGLTRTAARLRLIEAPRRRGFELWAQDGRVRIRGRQAPPPELLEALRDHREEVLELLQDRDDWPGSWAGWCAAYRHELARILELGVPFDEAEGQAVALLRHAPPCPHSATEDLVAEIFGPNLEEEEESC